MATIVKIKTVIAINHNNLLLFVFETPTLETWIQNPMQSLDILKGMFMDHFNGINKRSSNVSKPNLMVTPELMIYHITLSKSLNFFQKCTHL